MDVFLTGGTGYIGSAVLARLIEEGHEVTALVRGQEKAAAVSEAGATPLIGDLAEKQTLKRAAEAAEGVIHTASPGDESSGSLNDLTAGAILEGLEDSGKPFAFTGGIWTYGSNPAITEESRPDPVEVSAWRVPIEKWVLGVDGLRPIVVCPAIVYGHGKGLPNTLVQAPVDDNGLHIIGNGTQHWATVHVDDLAALYVLALENGDAGNTYIGASGENPTVLELGEAVAARASIGRTVAESVDASRARLGSLLADALLLDQQATGAKAKMDLGWEPNAPSLLDEVRSGSYTRSGD